MFGVKVLPSAEGSQSRSSALSCAMFVAAVVPGLSDTRPIGRVVRLLDVRLNIQVFIPPGLRKVI